MIVVRRCPFTGVVNQWDLPITLEQMDTWLDGALIQDAFPHLTPDEREFILTGITPQAWEDAFGSQEYER